MIFVHLEQLAVCYNFENHVKILKGFQKYHLSKAFDVSKKNCLSEMISIVGQLKGGIDKIFHWSTKNFINGNANKCYLITSSKTPVETAAVSNVTVTNEDKFKLLGIYVGTIELFHPNSTLFIEWRIGFNWIFPGLSWLFEYSAISISCPLIMYKGVICGFIQELS